MTEKVIAFIRNYYGLDDVEITADSKLMFDLGLSSFELVEMYSRLEEEFKIKVEEADIIEIQTVGDIVKCIEKNSVGAK